MLTLSRERLAVTFGFLAVALALGQTRPLWLDELLQLIDTRRGSLREVLELTAGNPGSAPLAYLLQYALLRVCDCSLLLLRLPAALFGAGALYLTAALGAELGLRRSWVAAAVLGSFPLTLRYMTEARGYAQGLFFAVLATLLFVRLARQPGWRMAGLYALALTAAVYTQPFAATVGLAHAAWALRWRRASTACWAVAGGAVAGLAFLPWYLWSHGRWMSADRFGFTLTARTPLILLREFTGAGYLGALVLVALCVLAARRRVLPHHATSLWVTGVPVVCALAADARFGYFIAARQFLWVLPALAVLAAAAVERRGRTLAYTLTSLLLVVCAIQNARFFTSRRENWSAAAEALAGQARGGARVRVIPAGQAQLYEFFHPELRIESGMADRTILAVTPYARVEEARAARGDLAATGYGATRQTVVGDTTITLFQRDAR
jgi:uncharacterized membrane protein